MPEQEPVIAVTPHGAIRFASVEDAIASTHTTLADPFFTADRPIDRTLIRGRGLEDYAGQDPWPYLLARAVELPEPPGKKRRA